MADKESVGGKLLNLPLSRVRTIMKSSPGSSSVSNESAFAVARCTELFVQYLAKEAYKQEKDQKQLAYNSLAKIIEEDDNLQFLADIVPAKILYKDYLEMMRKKKEKEERGEDSTSSDSDSD